MSQVCVVVRTAREALLARSLFPGAHVVLEGHAFCGVGFDVLVRTGAPTGSDWERLELATRLCPGAKTITIDLSRISSNHKVHLA